MECIQFDRMKNQIIVSHRVSCPIMLVLYSLHLIENDRDGASKKSVERAGIFAHDFHEILWLYMEAVYLI